MSHQLASETVNAIHRATSASGQRGFLVSLISQASGAIERVDSALENRVVVSRAQEADLVGARGEIDSLAERGVDSEIRPAGCAWSPGGDRMLACHRAG